MRYAFDLQRFAKDLHAAQWEKRLGTRGVGERVGVSASTVSRWENAKGEPAIVPFLTTCGILGLNPFDYIMTEDTAQSVLPGFEEHVQLPLIPVAQQQMRQQGEDGLWYLWDENMGWVIDLGYYARNH